MGWGWNVPEYPDTASVIDFVSAVGTAFLSGLAGGAAFHGIKGVRGSPSGGVRAMCANAPRVAGVFAAHAMVYAAFENAVLLRRGTIDNSTIIALAAATCALHGVRRGGASAAARRALLGGVGATVLAWNYEAMVLLENEESLRRQRRMNAGKPAPAALRPIPHEPVGDAWPQPAGAQPHN
jgi:hypothetical protein